MAAFRKSHPVRIRDPTQPNLLLTQLLFIHQAKALAQRYLDDMSEESVARLVRDYEGSPTSVYIY